MRFIIFFGTLISLMSVGSLYLYFKLNINPKILIGFLLLQIATPLIYRNYSESFLYARPLFWLSYIALGLFFTLLVFTICSDLLVRASKQYLPVDMEKRIFLASSIGAVLSSGIGLWQARRGPQIIEIEVPIAGLGPEFEHFKIAQISDLHIGPIIDKSFCESVVELTNAQNPDLVVCTGDFVDGSVADLSDDFSPLANLKAKHGLAFITGNHEYYWGVEDWLQKWKSIGAKNLINESFLISAGNSQISIGGIPDLQGKSHIDSHAVDIAKTFRDLSDTTPRILLAHQPSSYKKFGDTRIDLQLSGHTHGGQFFPWNVVVALAHKYYKGLNRHENTWIYVNSGTGFWGPPNRFAVPSEITLLKLRRA